MQNPTPNARFDSGVSLAISGLFYSAVMLTLTGCMVGPDYEPPAVEMPKNWRNPGTEIAVGEVRQPAWWKHFGDDVLESLVADAEKQNLGLLAAVQRIEEAKARYGVTRSDLWPNIDAIGAYRRVGTSQNGTNNRVSGYQFDDRSLWSFGGELNWEIDLWGRVRRASEAATAEVQASVEDFRDVLVVLQAEVVGTYVTIRSLQDRERILKANIEIQEASAKQAKTRSDTGVSPEIDVTQSEAQLASTRAELPSVQIQLEAAMNRMAVLLGKRPGSLHEKLAESGKIPEVPSNLKVPMPATLVRQRPDIRRAERELASATALIGVQTAELYPKLSIFGTFEWESTKATDLFERDSQSFSVGPFVRWRIFDADRIDNKIEIEKARVEQALKRYEETVLTAVGEVEDTLVADRLERERVEHLTNAAARARRSVELVQELYKNGLADYIRVLDAQREQLAIETLHVQARTRLAINLVNMYRALGGGWMVPNPGKSRE